MSRKALGRGTLWISGVNMTGCSRRKFALVSLVLLRRRLLLLLPAGGLLFTRTFFPQFIPATGRINRFVFPGIPQLLRLLLHLFLAASMESKNSVYKSFLLFSSSSCEWVSEWSGEWNSDPSFLHNSRVNATERLRFRLLTETEKPREDIRTAKGRILVLVMVRESKREFLPFARSLRIHSTPHSSYNNNCPSTTAASCPAYLDELGSWHLLRDFLGLSLFSTYSCCCCCCFFWRHPLVVLWGKLSLFLRSQSH